MGAAKNGADEAKDARRGKSSSRGSVDNAGRLKKFKSLTQGGGADWGSCDPRWIQACVVAITGLGGAITFGTSRDGGAYSCTLMLDGERETLWFNGGCVLDDELAQVYETLESM